MYICVHVYGNVSFVLVSLPGLSQAAEPFNTTGVVWMFAAEGRPGRTQTALERSRPDTARVQPTIPKKTKNHIDRTFVVDPGRPSCYVC